MGACSRSVLFAGFVLAVVLPVLSVGPARADVVAHAVDLSTVAESQPLIDPLFLLEDHEARLDATAALGARGWHPASSRGLSRGYTRSALWLAGEFYNGSPHPVTRWLSVGSVRLDDVRYYSVTDTNDPVAREEYRAGIGTPAGARRIDTALSVFPVTLAPGAHQRFLLRVQSRSAISLDVKLWSPEAYRRDERNKTMRHMFLVGVMLTIAAFAVVFGAVWRDRIFALLAASIVAEVLYELAYEGHLYEFWLRQGGDFVGRLPSITGNLTVVMFTVTVMAFVGLRKIPLWKWTYRTLACAMFMAAVWTTLGDYRVSASASIYGVFLCNIVWVISMLDGWRHGLPNARLLLLAFAPDCATLFLRLGVAAGLLSGRWVTGSAQIWDSLSILLLMVLIVGGRSRQVYRAQRAAQWALLDAQEKEAERLEQAVKARTGELQHALFAADDANRSKGDFLARISHDLRTPLTSIIGFADLILAAGREDAERGRVIRRSADHMLGMVNDLIDYAAGENPDTLRVEPVYVHALLETVGQQGATLAARSGNAFGLDIAGELPPVLELDGRRLQQMIGNLLDNAAKFTRDGTIRLAVESRVTDAARHLYLLALSVSDSGCGIAPEDQARIFEPFTRLDGARHTPGIGLGLAIVKQWAARMGGSVQVDSTPGRGTTIRIRIPARAVGEAGVSHVRLPEAVDALPAIDGAGRRVLVVEDAGEIRQLLHDDLASVGFEVEAVLDGTVAIARLEARAAALDLVLTDHLMPGANGDAVLAAARRHCPGVPVVVLSATPQKAVTDDVSSGTPRYDASLLKPVSLVDLRNTIARVLGLSRAGLAAGAALSVEPPVSPSGEKLEEARYLVELGAVSDLIEWADRLADDEPECEPFARRVGRLVRLGELANLEALLGAGAASGGRSAPSSALPE